jgi:ribosomal protein L11 methyltransferase
MKEIWLEITLSVPPEHVDLVSYTLTEQGAAGVVTAVHQLDTFVVPDPDRPETGPQTLHAYFPAVSDPAATCSRVQQALHESAPLLNNVEPKILSHAEVRQEDWAEGWKQHFQPFHVGRLLVRPTWDKTQPGAGEILLQIDPGMAFGTGSHGTTRLCLDALVRCFEQAPPATTLDVGTGSGILAIAAALLGSRQVYGCDIEAEACRIARENAALNNVKTLVEISDTPLEKITGRYNLVLANILAEENIRLARQLIDHTMQGGSLVLSGILNEKVALVRQTFDPLLGSPPELTLQDEWACLVYRR